MLKYYLFNLIVTSTLTSILCAQAPSNEEIPKIEFVNISGGSFYMGDNLKEGSHRELPVHLVTLSSFKLSKYEITNSQFCAFLNINGNINEGGGPWLDIESPYCNIVLENKLFKPKLGMGNHPVIEVSWYGSNAFALWLNARLPTEAEWEYAARNRGKKIRFTTGMSITNDLANMKGAYGRDVWNGTSPVGSFPPNEIGLYDMAGNIWEWCNDRYSGYSEENQHDPIGPIIGNTHVVRGGSWSFQKDYSRVTLRIAENGAYWSYDNGFRIAQNLK